MSLLYHVYAQVYDDGQSDTEGDTNMSASVRPNRNNSNANANANGQNPNAKREVAAVR